MSEDKARELLKTGGDLAGAAVGGALAFLAGDPMGAGIGATAGVAVRSLLIDVSNRVLSHQEERRVGATAAVAIETIRHRVESGDQIREDDFFKREEGDRSDAEELFEGVLLKAKNEHEEKKAKYLGNLFGNVAFDQWCSIEEANYIIRTAERLTYIQFILLKIARSTSHYDLRDKKYEGGEQLPYKTIAILESILEAHKLALIGFSDSGLHLQVNSINPSRMQLGVVGHRVFDLLNLEDIPADDVEEVRKTISKNPAEVFAPTALADKFRDQLE